MTEDYAIQVSFTLPPKAQYEKGAMLNVRATGTGQLAMFLEELLALSETDRPAGAVVKQFLDHFGAGVTPKAESRANVTKPALPPVTPAPKAAPVVSTLDEGGPPLTSAEIAEALGASIVDEKQDDRPPTDIQLAVAKQFGIDPTSHTRTSIAAAIKEEKARKK